MTAALSPEQTEVPGAPAGGTPVSAGAAWLVLLAGVIGLAASITLTVEKIRLLADSGYVPSCNLNPVLSCGSVMATHQASVVGFPNPILGIAGFTVVLVSGVLALAKVPLPRWYWAGLTVGAAIGTAFVHWLIFQSLYRIGALCPYCMVVWSVTIPLLVVSASIAFAPDSGHKNLQILHRWRWTFVALWFIALFMLIFIRFQDYWVTLI
ncbi:vitamin K epoxide reductase family protein [Mycobacterium sp. M1]|uniref:Vitamin K epoxide reductase family protein n=1 Tax=Mycolicibacter acidiphilus TaxID=2835306 RepID=A0ABS5RJ11_9MYCO|nr:vitamin K epoxide reductase family protein [Mycolicibacter acidiphilus]MBS9534236.1 vitamin K epoxide reductase family protein [Mycolicibacter acidiphilus]